MTLRANGEGGRRRQNGISGGMLKAGMAKDRWATYHLVA